ncbi:MAG: type 1 glutamine amidotransferase [Chloroflexi bacterium]|nr:type 1 glutamine amidotransferase [Ktedonobacteraceae bacterium]MBV9021412.1 type 1 glutamine amidotransferase [Ktedonobacteraceae bacterium]MBV9708670.1 type 1 glutamine amidotransferase [Chloroflexota bacterium]
MKHILVLQHAWDVPIGYLGTILQEHNIPYHTVNVETEPLPNPTPYGAIIVLGGSQHVYDETSYPYLIEEKALIRKTVEQDIPYLGICLGGQLLAHALGAQVKREAFSEVGFFDVQLTQQASTDPLFQGLPGYQKVFHWHVDSFDLPVGAVLLATGEAVHNQAFRYGMRAYALQYHIELSQEVLAIWLYHPEIKQSLIDTVGIDAYAVIVADQSRYYTTYLKHVCIQFENFLRIAGFM